MYWSKSYYKAGIKYASLRDVTGKEVDIVGRSQYLGLRTTYEPRTLLKDTVKVITHSQPVLSCKFPEMLTEQKPKGKYAVLLSGGVDSSILAKLYDGPDVHFIFVQTLLGTERPFFDMMAKTLKGTIHIVDLKSNDAYYQCSKDIYSSIREPVGDAAIVAVYAAAKYAKEELHIDQMVIGEGADEVFGGYWQYETFHNMTLSGNRPSLQFVRNTFGVAFDKSPEELDALWNFIPNELKHGAIEDYVLKAMGWDYLKGLQNLYFWKNIDGCALNGVTAILPYFHSNVYWYARREIPRSKIVDSSHYLKLKIFLKEFALEVGVPKECVDRVKMGFRCEVDNSVMQRMMSDMGKQMPFNASMVFALWSLNLWYNSMGVKMELE
jgi:asparagine synthetase B (glutamine-hydrolysing)